MGEGLSWDDAEEDTRWTNAEMSVAQSWGDDQYVPQKHLKRPDILAGKYWQGRNDYAILLHRQVFVLGLICCGSELISQSLTVCFGVGLNDCE